MPLTTNIKIGTLDSNGNYISYDTFKQIDISRSLDNMCGEAVITMSQSPYGNYQIQANSPLIILFDDIPKITGAVEKHSDVESSDSHSISYTIREAGEVIDSCFTLTQLTNIIKTPYTTFAQFMQKVINQVLPGAKITDENNYTFQQPINVTNETGKKISEFIDDYAKLCGAIISTDGNGNFICYKLDGTGHINNNTLMMFEDPLLSGNNNYTDLSLDIDYADRYYQYVIYHDGTNFINSNETILNTPDFAYSVAFDPEINPNRFFVITGSTPMTALQMQNRVNRERNLRRAKGLTYTMKVNSLKGDDGTFWDIGQTITVFDQKRNITGSFIIKEVKYSITDAGQSTTLSLTYLDAYSANSNILNKSNIGVIAGSNQTVPGSNPLSLKNITSTDSILPIKNAPSKLSNPPSNNNSSIKTPGTKTVPQVIPDSKPVSAQTVYDAFGNPIILKSTFNPNAFVEILQKYAALNPKKILYDPSTNQIKTLPGASI